MDWARAKNALIVAFLIIDLLLGYRLYAMRQKPELPSPEMAALTRVLSENTITIDSVPEGSPRALGMLRALPYRLPDNELEPALEDLLGQDISLGRPDSVKDGLITWQSENRTVSVTTSGMVTFIDKGDLGKFTSKDRPGDREWAEEKAGAMVKQFLPPNSECTIDSTFDEATGQFLVEFALLYKKDPLVPATAWVWVSPGGITFANVGALNVRETVSTPHALITAPAAISYLASNLVEQKLTPARITSMELAYYLPTRADVVEFQLIPVWEMTVEFSDGGPPQHFHVNAYIGAIEP